ncbi:MAG TPA: glycosyltransferase [Pyrinomonadaceae bacterium]|nr:glycosyltransferase [Pyrinomonadaceae bacterium]
MKVLHLLDSVNRGGAETQVLDLCRNASRFGLEVTLVSAGGGVLENDFRDSGVEYVRLNRKLPVDIYFSSQLRRIVKERNIQIVHGYQAVDGLHLYLATRRLASVKRVLSFQGFIPGQKNRITAKLVAPRMHANISVSESLFTYLADIGIKRRANFHVVYNGADERRLKPGGGSIKRELGMPVTTILGGMVANFVPDPTKDQLTICRAIPAVLEKFPDFHFVFAGRVADGAEGRMADCVDFCIGKGISDKVHFLGGRSDVADILSELDLFVFSSRQEGFPVAVSEAMLAGVPLIVSDIEPLREAVRDGGFGQLFRTGDVDDLSRKIIGVLQDTEQRESLAIAARGYALDHFSIDAHLRTLTSLYESLLKTPEGR